MVSTFVHAHLGHGTPQPACMRFAEVGFWFRQFFYHPLQVQAVSSKKNLATKRYLLIRSKNHGSATGLADTQNDPQQNYLVLVQFCVELWIAKAGN